MPHVAGARIGGAAERKSAGLRNRDIVAAMVGQAIGNINEVSHSLGRLEAGTFVERVVLCDGTRVTLTINRSGDE